jgi:hypothetical protein
MRRSLIMRSLVLTVLGISPKFANAQGVFAGFDSFCGLPVIVGYDPQDASARKDEAGRPFIHVDPGVMANWTHSRMFALAHECGHHRLGHTSSLGTLERFRGGTRSQELAADCWAAKALHSIGQNFDISRAVLINAAEGHFSGGDYPSGTERAEYIVRCAGGGPVVDPTPRCREVTEYMDQTVFVTQTVQQAVPCQHPVCGPFGCVPLHSYDVIFVPQQVPVTRRVPVTRTVCG